MARVAGRFGRVEPRRWARSFVLGLLSDLPRKNCWTIAEHAGDATPDGMQHLLSRAVWDADEVRDDVRDVAVERLGDVEAMLVVDETGDVKKGECTVGVQRQYTGTAGRIENARVGVFLTYTTKAGHTLIDREFYLPRSWTDDTDRCAGAGVPEDTRFATKPALASRMILRALDGGVPAAWVAGDEVYGGNPTLRGDLEKRQVGYVLAVACAHHVSTATGTQRADELLARLPKRAWQRLSAGKGVKGHRFYDWAWIGITSDSEHPGNRWLLIRRNRRTGELAYYRCYAPGPVPLATLVRVAGRRWTIEESFQTGKGQTGLDEHQVRCWTSWYRWTTLVLLAHAFLAITTVAARATPTPEGLIPLTLNEIRHLYNTLAATPAADTGHILACSRWRRRHQHRAQQAHYQRQSRQKP
ncbi:IS701 family transposase [Actinokineospora sp.]|uniref:IS701 family transposase n=1 Tax=Actinokineospora sp. TaxID=1872133 RepID=UPI004037C5F3